MADIETIGKSKLIQAGLQKLLGIKPTLDIRDKYVRVFYPPDKLKMAQDNFKKVVEKEPGKIRVEIAPIVTPYYVKKFLPHSLTLLGTGYLVGKIL